MQNKVDYWLKSTRILVWNLMKNERWIILMARGVIKAPFFEIGPKSYLYGDDVLELALAADKASEKYGVEIVIT